MLPIVISVLGSLLFILLFEFLAEQRDSRRYQPPGRLIQVNSAQVHVREEGISGPAVLLEAGLAASSMSWALTQPLIAGFARVIAYDRAGLAWSEPSKSAPVLDDLLARLHALVTALEISTPVILVGHSFGALLVQVFAHRYPTQTAGLVLVDPVSVATYADPCSPQMHRLQIGIRLSKRGAVLARFAVVRAALSLVSRGSRKLPLFIGRVSAGGGSSVIGRLAGEVTKLPPETHGSIRAHWSRSASFSLMAEYLRLLPEAAADARDKPVPPDIPIIVLSAATATPAELAERVAWTHNRPSSRHTQIPNTSHWLQLDRPDLVADAVRELTMLIR